MSSIVAFHGMKLDDLHFDRAKQPNEIVYPDANTFAAFAFWTRNWCTEGDIGGKGPLW
ncbi:hypothetical protein [Mesorhizobium sp.]|uniref:hypothetical protein n=1 Tax=Mesorhizobium sp. TaxID=1871066 RepID=UPI0026CCB806